MGFDNIDRLEFQGVEDKYVATGGRYVGSARRSVGGRGKRGCNSFLGEGIGQVAVFRGRGESTDSVRVGGCFDGG